MSNSSASKDDLSRLRAEVKKIYDGLHIGDYVSESRLVISEFLFVRTPRPADVCMGSPYVFTLAFGLPLLIFIQSAEQDVHSFMKREAKDAKPPPPERI